jgi:hypothetical protein
MMMELFVDFSFFLIFIFFSLRCSRLCVCVCVCVVTSFFYQEASARLEQRNTFCYYRTLTHFSHSFKSFLNLLYPNLLLAAMTEFHSSGSAELEPEDKACRYCFGDETEGPLISPCACKGGQKYVHLECLRRWQRMVLVSQSTHPAFQTDDERHHTCNVCKGEYTCPPPTRSELMASFTGAEIAALIAEGCIIASRDVFTQMLEETRRSADVLFPRSSEHWIRGVYLITQVTSEPLEQELPVSDPALLAALKSQIAEDLTISFQRRKFRLVNKGSLDGVATEHMRTALLALRTPATLVFANTIPVTCCDDHIGAVNLTRVISVMLTSKMRSTLSRGYDAAVSRYPGAAAVQIVHFSGGPCNPSEIATCIVPGGSRRGWTVVEDLEEALVLAHSRGARRTPAQGGECMLTWLDPPWLVNIIVRTLLDAQMLEAGRQ